MNSPKTLLRTSPPTMISPLADFEPELASDEDFLA